MNRIITSLPKDHPVLYCSLFFLQQLGPYKLYFDELPKKVKKNDLVLSLLGDVIIPPELINKHTYNIHPGPPWYRGWGSRLRAAMDQQRWHGTTLHRVVEKVDAGQIIKVSYFDIEDHWTIDEIHQQSENEAVGQVQWLVDHYKKGFNDFKTVAEWSGKFMYRKEYEELRKNNLVEA